MPTGELSYPSPSPNSLMVIESSADDDEACMWAQIKVEAHRAVHKLWTPSRRPLALALHSRISDVFAVDIHPAARIGKGVLFDHAMGVVIGETVVIGNNVSILHHVRECEDWGGCKNQGRVCGTDY